MEKEGQARRRRALHLCVVVAYLALVWDVPKVEAGKSTLRVPRSAEKLQYDPKAKDNGEDVFSRLTEAERGDWAELIPSLTQLKSTVDANAAVEMTVKLVGFQEEGFMNISMAAIDLQSYLDTEDMKVTLASTDASVRNYVDMFVSFRVAHAKKWVADKLRQVQEESLEKNKRLSVEDLEAFLGKQVEGEGSPLTLFVLNLPPLQTDGGLRLLQSYFRDGDDCPHTHGVLRSGRAAWIDINAEPVEFGPLGVSGAFTRYSAPHLDAYNVDENTKEVPPTFVAEVAAFVHRTAHLLSLPPTHLGVSVPKEVVRVPVIIVTDMMVTAPAYSSDLVDEVAMRKVLGGMEAKGQEVDVKVVAVASSQCKYCSLALRRASSTASSAYKREERLERRRAVTTTFQRRYSSSLLLSHLEEYLPHIEGEVVAALPEEKRLRLFSREPTERVSPLFVFDVMTDEVDGGGFTLLDDKQLVATSTRVGAAVVNGMMVRSLADALSDIDEGGDRKGEEKEKKEEDEKEKEVEEEDLTYLDDEFFCNDELVEVPYTRKSLQRGLLRAALEIGWGVVRPWVMWRESSSSYVKDGTWSRYVPPFGTFSDEVEVSPLIANVAKRNSLLAELNYVIHAARRVIAAVEEAPTASGIVSPTSALPVFSSNKGKGKEKGGKKGSATAIGDEKEDDSQSRLSPWSVDTERLLRARLAVLEYKVTKASQFLTLGRIGAGLYYVRSAQHDVRAVEKVVEKEAKAWNLAMQCDDTNPTQAGAPPVSAVEVGASLFVTLSVLLFIVIMSRSKKKEKVY